jgi:hypothetical protein
MTSYPPNVDLIGNTGIKDVKRNLMWRRVLNM